MERLARQFCSKACGYAFRKGKPSAKRGRHYPHLQRARVGTCKVCGTAFRAVGDFVGREQKFCSKECWNVRAGYRTKKCAGCGKVGLGSLCLKYCTKECERETKVGKKHPAWKGDAVGYDGLHKWVYSMLGRPEKCEHCGKDGLKGREIDWANKSQEYRRDATDWLRLCKKCHKAYDMSF